MKLKIKKVLAVALSVAVLLTGFGMFGDNSYAGTITAETTAGDGTVITVHFTAPTLGYHATYGEQNMVQPGDTVIVDAITVKDSLGFDVDMTGKTIQVSVIGANSANTGIINISNPQGVEGMVGTNFEQFIGSSLVYGEDENSMGISWSFTIGDGTFTPIDGWSVTRMINVFEGDMQYVENADGQVPVELNVEAMTMIIALPNKLPVSIDKDGNVVTLSGVVGLQNLSQGAVKINEVTLQEQGSFALKPFDKNYMKTQKVGTKEFAMKLGFEQVGYMREFNETTKVSGVDANVAPLGVMDFTSIFYDFTMAPQAAAIVNGTPAIIVFDIDFDTN